MRAALAYTSARILLFIAALALLYLVGARGLILLALALLASGLISFVVLSRARDRMSASLTGRLTGARSRLGEMGRRLDEGATAEDED
jgi:Mn2+/Fe2+ NRAMP family transporter